MIKSNLIVRCNSFSINREKLGEYLKWTDCSTYQRTYLSMSEILINHSSVLSAFAVNTKDDDTYLPSLYLIP